MEELCGVRPFGDAATMQEYAEGLHFGNIPSVSAQTQR